MKTFIKLGVACMVVLGFSTIVVMGNGDISTRDIINVVEAAN